MPAPLGARALRHRAAAGAAADDDEIEAVSHEIRCQSPARTVHLEPGSASSAASAVA